MVRRSARLKTLCLMSTWRPGGGRTAWPQSSQSQAECGARLREQLHRSGWGLTRPGAEQNELRRHTSAVRDLRKEDGRRLGGCRLIDRRRRGHQEIATFVVSCT